MVEPPVASVKWALVGRQICSEGKRVHLYGGAAAIRSDMMPLQEEKRCLVQELFVAFSFSLAFAHLCPCEYLVGLRWRLETAGIRDRKAGWSSV